MRKYQGFAFCERGSAHIRNNMKCEDAAERLQTEEFYIGAVADGLGSATYCRADRGAQFAVEMTCSVIKAELLELQKAMAEQGIEAPLLNDKTADSFFYNIKNEIIRLWNERIAQDMVDDPFSEEEAKRLSEEDCRAAYACTLIATGVANDFWFSIQVGDGNCVEFYADTSALKESTPRDPACYDYFTTHLAVPKVVENHFRHYWSACIPDAIFLHSDGIDDTKLLEDVRFGIYEEMILHFCDGYENGVEFVGKQVQRFAHGNMEKMDDTTLVGVVNMEELEKQKESIIKHLAERQEVLRGKQIERELKRARFNLQEKYDNCKNYEEALQRSNSEKASLEEQVRVFEAEARKLKASWKKVQESLSKCEKDIELFTKVLDKEKGKSIMAQEEVARLEKLLAGGKLETSNVTKQQETSELVYDASDIQGDDEEDFTSTFQPQEGDGQEFTEQGISAEDSQDEVNNPSQETAGGDCLGELQEQQEDEP